MVVAHNNTEWTVINSGATGIDSGAMNIDWNEQFRRVEEYENKQWSELCYSNFRKCGAYKRDMDRAGFEKLQNPKNNLHVRDVLDLLDRFYNGILNEKGFNKILVLYGEPGRGKTFFALSLLKKFCATSKPEYQVRKLVPEFKNGVYTKRDHWETVPSGIKQPHKGFYTTSENLAEIIDGRYKNKNEISEGKVTIDLYRSCELLVIDEIGRSLNNQKNEKEILFSILNTRINEYLPTVLCSNLTERQLQEFFGDALFSRVKSVGRMFCTDGLDDMRMILR